MWSIPPGEHVLDFEDLTGDLSMRIVLITLLAMGSLEAMVLGEDDRPAGSELETITFQDSGRVRTISGRVLIKAVDGGLLVQERDGRLWTVTADVLERRESTGTRFRPEGSQALGNRLAAELDKRLGPGFAVHRTRHYTIVSSADPRFAKWVGTLFERLRTAFLAYWKGRGVRLDAPEFPLVAIVLKDRQQFAKYVQAKTRVDPTRVTGFYNILTNRIILYDIARVPGRPPAATAVEIQRRLGSAPQAIATVVHEAAHQVAYNSGLNRRLADNPLWLVEGMAVFFETPDLRSRSGWRTVGKVNLPRLVRFADFVRRRRQAGSLQTLVESDRRFRDDQQAADAYAEAWALNYFLLRTRKKSYGEYLERIGKKGVLRWDGPETRREDFEKAFGADWDTLDRAFLKYMSRVKAR
tara:strand:- start:1005 stop:2237 length:1233 start_codon:yes stop_codon:yes gene_type:complete